MKKQIFDCPYQYFLVVVVYAVILIILGSFIDYGASSIIVHSSAFNAFIEDNANMVAYSMVAISGVLVFKGFAKKDKFFLAYLFLVIAFSVPTVLYKGFLVEYISFGTLVFKKCLSAFLCVGFYGTVSFVVFKMTSDEDADYLIKLGFAMMISFIISGILNKSLKEIAHRPRYRFLVSDKNTENFTFVNWWNWNIKRGLLYGDNFKSYPSGHLTATTMLIMLPYLNNISKYKKKKGNIVLWSFAFAFMIFMSYNRLATGAHFLSDIGFGILYTVSIYYVVTSVILKNGTAINSNKLN